VKILIIEDEREILSAAREYLTSEGYTCEEARTFKQGIEKINQHIYDCVVLDIGLPDGNGLKLIDELRGKFSEAGIVIISAKNSLHDKLTGLDLGADDYLTKPFHLSELNARIKSVLRRRVFKGKNEIIFKEILVTPDTLRVTVNGLPVTLTKKEFDLIVYFISNVDKVLTRESIVEHLWPDYADSADSYDFVYTHVSNLRKKLLDADANDYIRSVYGVGYKFSDL
jgi:DNA-binding response OmpR family regulator